MAMQILIYLLWIYSCIIVLINVRKWKYLPPGKDEYLVTGLYIILITIVVPAYLMLHTINSIM